MAGLLRKYLKTTANASRGLTGNAGVGCGNFFAEAGPVAPEEMIRGIDKGLYVTELIGFGVNVVTGDYSRGAVGHWVEDGEIKHPVHEVTIAGNLRDLYARIAAIGSDRDLRGGRRLLASGSHRHDARRRLPFWLMVGIAADCLRSHNRSHFDLYGGALGAWRQACGSHGCLRRQDQDA